MMFLGVDPGQKGGVGLVDEFGGYVDSIRFENTTDHDVGDWLIGVSEQYESIRAIVEKVSSSPQMGVVSSFTFGNGFGFIRGILTAVRVPFEMATPQRWQKELGCMSGGDKNITKAAAQRLWPAVKFTHGNADAVLIAEFGRRQWAKTSPAAQS